jgi:hypothetical protein
VEVRAKEFPYQLAAAAAAFSAVFGGRPGVEGHGMNNRERKFLFGCNAAEKNIGVCSLRQPA